MTHTDPGILANQRLPAGLPPAANSNRTCPDVVRWDPPQTRKVRGHDSAKSPTRTMKSEFDESQPRPEQLERSVGFDSRFSAPELYCGWQPPERQQVCSLLRDQVTGIVETMCLVINDMLHMKYGVALDEAELARKVEAAAQSFVSGRKGRSDFGDSWIICTPDDVVDAVNNRADFQLRVREARHFVTMRLESQRIPSFDELERVVRKMPGTARAVALCQGHLKAKPCVLALAVFREDYGHVNQLIGHSGNGSNTPLVAFKAEDFLTATILDPQIIGELHFENGPDVLVGTPPPVSEEYMALSAWLRPDERTCLVHDTTCSRLPWVEESGMRSHV